MFRRAKSTFVSSRVASCADVASERADERRLAWRWTDDSRGEPDSIVPEKFLCDSSVAIPMRRSRAITSRARRCCMRLPAYPLGPDAANAHAGISTSARSNVALRTLSRSSAPAASVVSEKRSALVRRWFANLARCVSACVCPCVVAACCVRRAVGAAAGAAAGTAVTAGRSLPGTRPTSGTDEAGLRFRTASTR